MKEYWLRGKLASQWHLATAALMGVVIMPLVRTMDASVQSRWRRGSKLALSPPVWVNETSAKLTGTDSVSSESNPKWRQQVRNHQNATTGRTILRHKHTGGYGFARADFTRLLNGVHVPCWSEASGRFFNPTSWPSLVSSTAAADQEALMGFYKDAQRAITAFSGLTFLGELRETLQMLRRPGRALRGGLDDYLKNVQKRSRRAKRSSLNRIVSETWLEHAFGWKPFISDVRNAGEALNRRLERYAGNYTDISSTGKVETATPGASFDNLDPSSWIRLQYRVLNVVSGSVRYYGQVKSVCDNPIQADTQLFGASWTDVVPTAWELIPYSFLADYFTNIGDVLSAWSVRTKGIAWISKSIKKRSERKLDTLLFQKSFTEAQSAFSGWIGVPECNLGAYSVVREETQRTPTTPVLPSIQMEIPGLGTKWINMSALLGARNRTRRQLFR